MASVPSSFSMLESDLAFIDAYQAKHGLRSRSDVVREALEALRTGRPTAEQFVVPAANHDYSNVIRKAERLVLVFNDMRRWLDNHEHNEALRQRIYDRQWTRVFLLHPKSPIINFIAEISGKTEVIEGENRQVHDIRYAVKKLCSGIWEKALTSSEEGIFRIIGHRRVNTYSMVLDQETARVVFYPISYRYNPGVIWLYRCQASEAHAYEDFLEDATELERISVTYPDHDLAKLFSVEE